MMTKPLLLHVGYHKTATTWMQKLLFTPAHGYRQIATHREIFSHVVRPLGMPFDPAPMRDLIAARLAALAPDEAAVISSEILSGHPFRGGHEAGLYAERLQQIAPQARILISIRDQMRILPSVYMQYILRGGTMPYDLFFKGTEEIGYFGFTPEHFEYDRLVGRYQALFGAENVHVLTQESLQRDADAAAAKLAGFARAPAFPGLQPQARRIYAASHPEYAAAVLRRINHVQSSTLNPTPILKLGETPYGLYRIAGYLLRRGPFKALLKAHKPVSEHVRRTFPDRYSASNRRLAACVGPTLDLTGYQGSEPGAAAARLRQEA